MAPTAGRRPRPLLALPLLLMVADPACPPSPAPEPPRVEPQPSTLAKAEADATRGMADHFAEAGRIEEALIHGRVAHAREAAAALAALSPSSYPADWMPWVLEMRTAAENTANAKDTSAASAGLGEILAACGACHQGLGEGPEFAPPSQPPADATEMQIHRWTAERMREGVVGPSNESWTVGTQRFPQFPECKLDPSSRPGGDAAIQVAHDQARAIAADAPKASDARARAKLYGDYVATCSACHETGCEQQAAKDIDQP